VNFIIWALALFALILDQLSKYIVSSSLDIGQSKDIIKGIFSVTLVYNTGAAFGIFKNQALFFIIISILAIAFIAVLIKRKTGTLSLADFALGLILGGAIGNLIDRLRFGCVIDFLDFKVWPVFNIADSAITIGVFLLIISMFKQSAIDKKKDQSL